MPFVHRNDHGEIVSIKRETDDHHSEFLAPTHVEIISFLTDSTITDGEHAAKNTLLESDQGFTRVTEDLIYLLIQKNIILFTELPAEVQIKMVGREKLRSNLSGQPYNFLDDGESI